MHDSNSDVRWADVDSADMHKALRADTSLMLALGELGIDTKDQYYLIRTIIAPLIVQQIGIRATNAPALNLRKIEQIASAAKRLGVLLDENPLEARSLGHAMEHWAEESPNAYLRNMLVEDGLDSGTARLRSSLRSLEFLARAHRADVALPRGRPVALDEILTIAICAKFVDLLAPGRVSKSKLTPFFELSVAVLRFIRGGHEAPSDPSRVVKAGVELLEQVMATGDADLLAELHPEDSEYFRGFFSSRHKAQK